MPRPTIWRPSRPWDDGHRMRRDGGAHSGRGGVLPLNQDYVNALRPLCQKKDWLLAVDEVQTGVGRTGSLFCFQDYGILPDVVSFAKGIGGGLSAGRYYGRG